mgnify:CR=1 FL=1
MAGIDDIVASSMSINSRLPAQLEKALERNIVLRIGWTTGGEPVPKDGELGLCPNLPDGSKVRSLGYGYKKVEGKYAEKFNYAIVNIYSLINLFVRCK